MAPWCAHGRSDGSKVTRAAEIATRRACPLPFCAALSQPKFIPSCPIPADADGMVAAGASMESPDPTEATSLIPGLKDAALALRCLAHVPRSSHSTLRCVSRAWRRALASRELYCLRRRLGLQETWIYLSLCRRCPSEAPLPPSSPPLPAWMHNVWVTAYDPKNNVWHTMGTIPGLRPCEILKGFGFVSTDQRLYVIGGRLCKKQIDPSHRSPNQNGFVETDVEMRREVFSVDCTTGKWTQCASMGTPRVDFACTVAGGLIYVAGGRWQPGVEKGVASAEVYYPEEDRWEALPPMSTGRYRCVGVTVDHKVHVIGGFAAPEGCQAECVFTIDRSSVDVFHPDTRRWELLQGMWQLDIPPNQIVSLEGKFYSSGDLLQLWKGRIEMYDERMNMWKEVNGSHRRMRQKEELQGAHRCFLTMAAIASNLYFIGGYRIPSDPLGCLDTIDVFHLDCPPGSKSWTCIDPVRRPCHEAKDLCSHCCVVAV